MELRERIVQADPTLTVGEILSPDVAERLATIAPAVADIFSTRKIRWSDKRDYWGLSWDLTRAKFIDLGSMRGHHISDRPAYSDVGEDEAEWIVAREAEGRLLHELGHAVLTAYQGYHPELYADTQERFHEACEVEGLPSTYGGEDGHEQFSEALRLWAYDPERFHLEFPMQAAVVEEVLEGAEWGLS